MTATPGGDGSGWWHRHRLAADRLEGAGIDSAEREAGWLVEEVGGPSAVDLVRGGSAAPTAEQMERLDTLVDRRVVGEPVQYVLGHWPFRLLDLIVDGRVLIPRPETEQVVEVALAEADRMPEARVALDLGTGSGAIALSLVTERPGLVVWAVDRDADALEVAETNRVAQGAVGDRVRLLRGDWFEPLPDELRGTVDLVVVNPPYVEDGADLDVSVVEWEPAQALFSGPDGLDAIRTIVRESVEWLSSTGVLVVEIGSGQGAAVERLAVDGGFGEVEVRHDLAGLDRILVARRPAG